MHEKVRKTYLFFQLCCYPLRQGWWGRRECVIPALGQKRIRLQSRPERKYTLACCVSPLTGVAELVCIVLGLLNLRKNMVDHWSGGD